MTLEITKIHRPSGPRPEPELLRRESEIWKWAKEFAKEPNDFLINIEERWGWTRDELTYAIMFADQNGVVYYHSENMWRERYYEKFGYS